MSHFDQLSASFNTEWANKPNHTSLARDAYIENDGNRFWTVYDSAGNDIIKWECRNFPGCATLIITTKVDLGADLRGYGLGRYFRELRHRAYMRAGFQGEIATVRADNASQNRLMQSMGGVVMGEFPSDFGGMYRLWVTKLTVVQPIAVTPVVTVNPVMVNPVNPTVVTVNPVNPPVVTVNQRPIKLFSHQRAALRLQHGDKL